MFFEGQTKIRLPGPQFPRLLNEDGTNFNAEMVREGG